MRHTRRFLALLIMDGLEFDVCFKWLQDATLGGGIWIPIS
jgi:hypothetical protein